MCCLLGAIALQWNNGGMINRKKWEELGENSTRATTSSMNLTYVVWN
jgi:hypothetical protein